jgi:pyrroloquinoline quinone biosynthesis protein E
MMEPQPLSLLAEITYRCNLQCPYCYNPLDLGAYREELDAASWCRVIDEAGDLGIMQLHLSGGEPTLRAADCCTLIRHARKRELYVNLITQGTFLSDELLDQLLDAGLEHIQLSLQGADAGRANHIAGARVHERKLEALRRVVTRDVALTINCVLHRGNIDNVESIIALAESLDVRRLELANAQFYGWAFANRAALLPSPEQVQRAAQAVRDARERLGTAMEINHVLADYYQEYPKPCMNGWGRRFMTIAPDGRALPCPAAAAIASLHFDNVRDRSLADIWFNSDAFNAYRGTGWMSEPCRSCERREIDWGGCRCQAFLVTGDAGATDPACSLSPQHGLIAQARMDQRQTAFAPRRF